MTNNTQRPDDRPARKGHGLFDVLPQRHDPLPEGKWLYNDGELKCVEVVGDRAIWYVMSMWSIWWFFYPLFLLWLLIYFSGIGFFLKKLGLRVPAASFKQWVYDYPNLWGQRFVFGRHNFLVKLHSTSFQNYFRQWEREDDYEQRAAAYRIMNSRR